uniref:Uncharacterized protein n=1 Tax=Oryza meridionalis TaxID=40149 RepID=A0A0E0E942_9ORYZ
MRTERVPQLGNASLARFFQGDGAEERVGAGAAPGDRALTCIFPSPTIATLTLAPKVFVELPISRLAFSFLLPSASSPREPAWWRANPAVLMDPNRSSAYYSFLDDSEVAHPFGQSSSQVDLLHRQDDFPYAHAEFPAFSTQPPPDGTGYGGPRVASRSGAMHHVQAHPVGEADGRGRMYYTHDEDLST